MHSIQFGNNGALTSKVFYDTRQTISRPSDCRFYPLPGALVTYLNLFLAFGGGDSPIVSVTDDRVIVSNRLILSYDNNSSDLWVKGLIPYAFGNDSAIRLSYDGEYSELTGLESLADLDDVVLGFISLDYGEQLSAAGPDERSIIIIAGGELEASDDRIQIQPYCLIFQHGLMNVQIARTSISIYCSKD